MAFLAVWLCLVQNIGYAQQPVLKKDSLARDSIQAKNLKEVSISVKKAYIQHKTDRVVVNVDALISNAGTSALEVLEKAPGVTIDQNGVISLKGKQGVTIFIDDKPSYLSGADLQNYLQSLPSSTLEQVELMTNPPSRYDAAGNAGVINIKTKKGRQMGFNGALNLGLTQGQLTRANQSLNLNYRTAKFNFFGQLSDNLNNSFQDLDIYRTYKNPDGSIKSFFNQNTYSKTHGHTLSGKAGVDYYLSDKTTWGMVFTGMARKSRLNQDNTSNLLNPMGIADSILMAYSVEDIDFKNGGINANYRHQYAAGHELTFDADYLTYRNQTHQVYNNFSYLPNKTLKSSDILTGVLPANVDIYSLKGDYTRPLASGWKLDGGLKFSLTKTDNTADYATTIHNTTKPDYEKSNHFLYKEQISAGYLNLSKETKRISLQVGLRMENTLSDGHQYGNVMKPDSIFKRTYLDLFPTAFLTWKLDTVSRNQIGLNYGRRIDRPYYQDLNPFLSPLDKFTYYLGNPFLKPAYTQSIELSHTYKNILTTTLSWSSTKDQVNETIEIVNGIYYSKPGNIGTQKLIGLSADAGYDLRKWLNLHVFMQVAKTHSISDFYTGPLDTKGTFYQVNPTLQFHFEKGWNAELSGSYQSKVVDAQFIAGAVKQARAAVMKVLSPKATLKLSVSDLFYSRVNSGVINNLALTDASYRGVNDSRAATLSFSYRFGKTIANLRKHEATGAEAEQNRVKN